ncbi:male sterility protein-domain-containing protein [Nemania abortiva]|nr:male sterility protein-domain-containing protein [Nemania abortiva]
MLLVRLQSEIHKIFNVTLYLFQLFDATTLGRMATLIKSNSSSETNNIIDWEAETAVAPDIFRIPIARRFMTTPEIVVLTGATGFLGRALLTRFRLSPKPIQVSQGRLHKGDLASPRLGSTKSEASKIFANADVVIHNGADISFMKPSGSLKPANLEATKELLRLSVPHQLSFHYIFAASVMHLTGQESFGCSEGYLATKWSSERCLEKVSDKYELPIWIHQPSSITGDGAPATDLMTNLLTYSRLMKAVPDTGL